MITEYIKKFIIAVALWLCFSSTSFGKAKNISLVAFTYPPFYFMENGSIKGVAIDLTKELFGRMNLKTEITMLPLKRALLYLSDGTSDGLMILIKTPEREKYISFTDTVFEVRGLIWSSAQRKDVKVNFNRLEDLKHYKIGVTLGYSYGPRFDRLLKNMNVEAATGDFNNYRKLMAKRIDIFPGNEIVAKSIFKQHPELKGKFVHSDKSFIKWDLRMGISRKSSLISSIPKINTLLKTLRTEGYINRKVVEYTE